MGHVDFTKFRRFDSAICDVGRVTSACGFDPLYRHDETWIPLGMRKAVPLVQARYNCYVLLHVAVFLVKKRTWIPGGVAGSQSNEWRLGTWLHFRSPDHITSWASPVRNRKTTDRQTAADQISRRKDSLWQCRCSCESTVAIYSL